MTLIKIILTEPFIRHPAGLVFELNEVTGTSGWDDDERARERLNFSNKRTYHLPDGGNGATYELPVSYTAVCPPEVFEKVDLRTGPCRVTGAKTLEKGEDIRDSDLKYSINLLEMNGINAQGLQLPVQQWAQLPKAIRLLDRLREQPISEFSLQDLATGGLDFSKILPGFYELGIEMSDTLTYQVQWMKSFPLVVNMAPNGHYTTQPTLY